MCAEMLLQVLVTFFSTPFSHKQTLAVTVHLKPQSAHAQPFLPFETGSPLQLDKTCTKSLVLNLDTTSSPITSYTFVLQPLKLKRLTVKGRVDVDLVDLTLFFSQPDFDVQYLEILSINMRNTTFEGYAALLRKESLKEVNIVRCSFIEPEVILLAAKLRGFHLKNKVEISFSQTSRTGLTTVTSLQLLRNHVS